MIRITNRHKERHSNAIYCGRPSILGNPWVIGYHGTRAEVIEKYGIWLGEQLKIKDSPQRTLMVELYRKHKAGEEIILECFCAPLPCHCEKIKEILEK